MVNWCISFCSIDNQLMKIFGVSNSKHNNINQNISTSVWKIISIYFGWKIHQNYTQVYMKV